MAFLKRLGWYLVGLSMGLVFLVFFLKKKSGENGIDFCYLPNCRVLKDIRSKKLSFSEKLQDDMVSHGIDSLSVMAFLEDGDVDFKNSDTKSDSCKSYRIQKDIHNVQYELVIKNCTENAVVEKLSKS